MLRIVMMLKRWRDEHQDVRSAIKSILLQVLVARCLTVQESDAQTVVSTLESMYDFLRGFDEPPTIPNPVLNTENLAGRWEQEAFRDFVETLGQARDLARNALGDPVSQTSNDAWQELFGESFPNLNRKAVPESVASSKLGLTLHAVAPKWPMVISGSVTLRGSIEIAFTKHRFSRKSIAQVPYTFKVKRDIASGAVLDPGLTIHYSASTSVPKPYEVWWQVVNTGQDASRKGGLRGQIFQNDNATSLKRTESSQYIGTHWIECFIVKDGNCAARSGRFYIEVEGTPT